MLEEAVNIFIDVGSERIRDNAPESKRAMAEFAPALKPSGYAALRQRFARTVDKRVETGIETADQLAIIQFLFDLGIREFRAECRVRKAGFRRPWRLAACLGKRGADAENLSSRCRRNKYAVGPEMSFEPSDEQGVFGEMAGNTNVR